MNGDGFGGVCIATVTGSQLDEQGRISIEVPSTGCRYQACLATPMAGKGRGLVFLPDQGEQVVVAFVGGPGTMPVVLGSLWSNVAKPPIDNADGKNDVKLIQTRSGHRIRLNDEAGKESIEIVDKTGKNLVRIDTASNRVSIEAPDGEIVLSGRRVSITADQALVVSSTNSTVDITAKANMTITGQMIDLN